jgi:formate hydrogenlyase transcriptional activator
LAYLQISQDSVKSRYIRASVNLRDVMVDSDRRHELVLRAWEATNIERDLRSVMGAVAEVLSPHVSIDGMGIVVWSGTFPTGGAPRLLDIHVGGGVPNERVDEILREADKRIPRPPDRPIVPYDDTLIRDMHAGIPYMCADLLAKQMWYPHEHRLVTEGIRAYTSVPMNVRSRLLGTAVFSRRTPVGFDQDQVSLLSDVSRALAVAVTNALANEEIRALRDQLEAENVELRAKLGQAPWFDDIVGESPALCRVLESVEQVAPADTTVLLTGETGTGKELIARAIHRRSARSKGPLVTVHCAAIPNTLLASELFGHERGAFTGASDRRKGRFEKAHGGTLFLDEVGELPPDAQVMLLRVLQEREFERLGGGETVRVDVRVVGATNRDLGEEVRAGRFRDDLYYRLNVFPIRIPPLRERLEDIGPLVARLAAKHATRLNRTVERIDKGSQKLLESYDWPGNVRELENVVERAVILSRHGTLRVERDFLGNVMNEVNVGQHLRNEERDAIESALRLSHGRISGPDGAAKRLGLPASTLEFRIKRLGIDKFSFR